MTKSNTTLTELAKAISNESVKIVDLTNTLSPDFPVIILPPEFGQCEQFKMETLSRYDGNGPAWYWNNISMNEHTGTHFDAPAHWVTGKNISNNTVETIPVKDFVAPAVVINISEEAKINPDFLLTKEYLMEWEKIHGKIPPKNWIALRTDWYKLVGTEKYLNMQEDGAHSPGPDLSLIHI